MSDRGIKNPRPANDEDLRIDPEAGNAADTVCWVWEKFVAAKTPLEQAQSLIDLNNAMHDLSTYIPGYNERTGEIERAEF